VSDSLFFVLSNPVDGAEDAFNKWYDETHVHEVLAVPGISTAQRYMLKPHELPANDLADIPPPAHGYLAVYEVAAEPATVMTEFMARLGSGAMTLSPALDLATVTMGFWEPRGPRLESP
jgi:hypothetical protein